jgi:hypothetical protein
MNTRLQKLTYAPINGVYVGLSVLFVFMGLGCASTHKTTKTETVVTRSSDTPAGVQQNKGIVYSRDTTAETTETTKTTETTETKSGHPGFLSSTVHAIGWVIALPFRLVGGLIGWIF